MLIGISADDLTSATDGAISFAQSGHPSEVRFDHSQATFPKSGVISINKNSRMGTKIEAAQRATTVAAKLASADVLYHTVDSTIRGHIEAEILAALAASGRKFALLAPAFPEGGRTTINGEQRFEGRPVEASIFGQDPVHPVHQSVIRMLFNSLNDDEVQTLDLAAVRALEAGCLKAGKHKLIIADALLQSDLNRLVRAVAAPHQILFCGSPGMARALANRFVATGKRTAVGLLPDVTLLLAVIGSANDRSINQKNKLLTLGNSVEITINATEASTAPIEAARHAIDKAKLNIEGTKIIVLGTGPVENTWADPAQITTALACAAAEIVRCFPIDGLILTGGDTAAAVFQALNTPSLKLAREIEPGIPLGVIEQPRKMVALTKAGGFGTPEVLANAAKLMLVTKIEKAR